MSGITILSASPALERSLLEIYGRDTSIRSVWSDQWRDPVEVSRDACAADPELLVFGSDVDRDLIRSVVPEVDQRFPATTILLMVLAEDTEFSLEMFRLGARDVLVHPPDIGHLRDLVDPVWQVARQRHVRTAGSGEKIRRRVITVLSPKGGSGKTTVATNLAVGLARLHPRGVLLIDLDLQFGDAAPALGLQPEYSLSEATKAMNHDRSALKVFLTGHESGLALLAPPSDLASAEAIDAEAMKRTIAALAEEFPFVIIDTASGIDTPALGALEFSTDLLFVSTTDVPSVRAVRRELEAFDRVGFVSQRRTMVLNRSNARVGLSASDVEAAVGLKVTFEIPSTRLVPISTNEGVPVIMKDGGNVSRRFEEIVAFFAPSQDDERGRSRRRGLRRER